VKDRESLGRFNALLRCGLSLQAAEQASGLAALSERSAAAFTFIKDLCLLAGGSPVSAMDQLQTVLISEQQSRAQVQLALAAPKATTRLVLWLPLAALVLGQFSGIGSIEVFFKNSIAVFSVVFGLILLLAANLWSSRLLRKVQPKTDDFIVFDAMALCLSAGLSLSFSRARVCEKYIAHFSRAVSDSSMAEVDELVAMSEQLGAPIAKLLIERANELRANADYKKLEAIEKLSIKLLWPLGALVLPAFVFIAVTPMAISLLTKG
jgi:tight adherence protein B